MTAPIIKYHFKFFQIILFFKILLFELRSIDNAAITFVFSTKTYIFYPRAITLSKFYLEI
jgi:hypothetical protein